MSTLDLTKDNFRDFYEKNDLVFIIFRADWCGPCQGFRPVYEAFAAQNNSVAFGTVDVDTQPEISEYFSVRSVPFVVIVRQGVELYAEPGVLNEDQLKELVKRAQSLDMDDVKKKMAEEEAQAIQQETPEEST